MRLNPLHGGCRLRAKSKGELFCHISHSHNPNRGRQRHSKIGKVMWLDRVKAWVQFSSVPWTPESCGQYPEILYGPTEESESGWQCWLTYSDNVVMPRELVVGLNSIMTNENFIMI